MPKYCVELTPLEPYFFAGERSFGFGKEKKKNYNNYFIRSEILPSQTTLLGTLRYVILKRMYLLSDQNSQTSQELINQQAFYVGQSSFDMSLQKQNFGKIVFVGPLFLKDTDENIFVKTPYHQDPTDLTKLKLRNLNHHVSLELMQGTLSGQTSNENVSTMKMLDKIVLKDEWKVRSSFVSLNENKKIVPTNTIFDSVTKVGINKNATENGYFKKEYWYIKDYKMCFYVDLENDQKFIDKMNFPIDEIVYLGMGKSAFKFKMFEESDNLDSKVKTYIKSNDDSIIYYALSDIYVDYKKIIKYCDLILNDTKTFRNLKTVQNSKNYYNRYRQGDLCNLICSGSVFFVKEKYEKDFENEIKQESFRKIGFNQIIKLEEKKNDN